MRPAIVSVFLLTLAASPAAALPPEVVTSSRRVTRRAGSRWLGADVARAVVARRTRDRAEVEVTTDARLRLLTGSLTVFRLRERTAGADLRSARRRAWRGVQVELLGAAKLTVTHTLFKRTFKVAAVKLPVFAVGPFPVTLEVEVGAYLRLRLKGELAFEDGPSVAGGVEAMARLGATARLGPGAPGVKVGLKGEVDLLKARLPAMVTLHRDAVAIDVKAILESRAAIKLFARVGLGPFTKELSVGVPFLSWRLFKLEETLFRATLRAP